MPTDPSILVQLVATGNAAALRDADLSGIGPGTRGQLVSIAVALDGADVLRALGSSVLARPDADGKTAAFLAASTGKLALLTLVAELAPVSLGLPVPGGVTPMDAAWLRGHDDCVALLAAHGIPDPIERWESCCEGEACGPRPERPGGVLP